MAATEDVIEKGELENTKVRREEGREGIIRREMFYLNLSLRRLRRTRSPTTRMERRRRMSVTPVKMTRRSYSFR